MKLTDTAADLAPFPEVSDTFLARLKLAFPDCLPKLGTPADEVHALIGEQRVIAFLASQNALQNEKTEE